MKTIAIAILLILFAGFAGAASWTPTYNAGHSGGDAFPGPVTAYGLDATYAPTDVPNTNNGYGMVAIQTIAAAESSDDDQIKAAKVNERRAGGLGVEAASEALASLRMERAENRREGDFGGW